MSRSLMFIHGLWKIAGNAGRFLTEVKRNFYNVGGRHWAVGEQPEGTDIRRPSRVFYVRSPLAASRMGEVSGRAVSGSVSGGVGALTV